MENSQKRLIKIKKFLEIPKTMKNLKFQKTLSQEISFRFTPFKASRKVL